MTLNAYLACCFIAMAALSTTAVAQVPPTANSGESTESIAFTECWFRGKEAGTPEAQSGPAFLDCQAAVRPEVERQRASARTAEEEMAATYRALHARLEAGASVYAAIQPRVLLEDQRAWVKYRNSHCALEMARTSKGNWRLEYRLSRCVEDEARERTAYLREFLDGLGG